MLSLYPFSQHFFVKCFADEVIVRDTFARQYSPAIIDQRHDKSSFQTFIFGLNMIDNVVEFYVCIKTRDHYAFFTFEKRENGGFCGTRLPL